MGDSEEAGRFVRGLYRGVLRREPDADGFAHYVRCVLDGCAPSSILDEFLASDEFHIAPSGVRLFVPPGHFYSPIVDPAQLTLYGDTLFQEPAPDTLHDIAIDRAAMVRTWHALLPFLLTAPFAQARIAPFRYVSDNPHFGLGDGRILHAMLRHIRPARLIEIGSGWSSACTLDTVEHYLDGACELTFIEPHPRLLRDLLGEAAARVCIIERQVQHVPLDVFTSLQANDILFIDSTHVLRTGSDVCFELFEILPRLAQGVIVHIHDMFWPFEYPRDWVIDENRSWNEVYAVRAFLANNAEWNILMFNDWMIRFEHALIERTFPSFLQGAGCGLWLQRR